LAQRVTLLADFLCLDLIQIKEKGLEVVFSEEGGFSKVSEDSIGFQGTTVGQRHRKRRFKHYFTIS